ncbi:MAG: hypothetical protein E6J52_13135 [Chloroflexi bacterium]|nr:MAG: hypothetical protein E6J52_13135 [Chloroflexota bacterium]
MSSRRWFIAIALASGALSAFLYYGATQRVEIVTASRDIEVPRPLSRDDLDVRQISADLAPTDAIVKVEDAVGLVPRSPLLRVGRAPAGRTVELLASSALVLDVRGESGAAFTMRDPKASLTVDRIASVVIAIATADEMRFADRIATSTFVLVLATDR